MVASSRPSAQSITVQGAEQQGEENQHSNQPPSMQQDVADPATNITRLRPDGELMSLQTFIDTRLCGGFVHPRGIQSLAHQVLNVRRSTAAPSLAFFCDCTKSLSAHDAFAPVALLWVSLSRVVAKHAWAV